MNIALIRPPKISGAFEKILIQEPINLVYLATYLNSRGFKSVIWDFEAEEFSAEKLRRLLEVNDISLAGITAMTPTIRNAHHIARTIKQINKKITTVIGGPHATAIPGHTLQEFPDFDYAVIGEGEIPLSRLCRSLKDATLRHLTADIDNIAFRRGTETRVNRSYSYIEDLDSLPLPDRRLLNRGLYKNIYTPGIERRGRIVPTVVFTSRGCPQDCTFCAIKNTHGRKTRFLSVENVLRELRSCKELGYTHITFEDTNLTLNRQRFLKICRGLKELGLSWDCQSLVSLIDKELIGIMKNCGCLKIAFGAESGSQRILDLMKKNITVTQIEAAFSESRRAGISTCAFFILGTHPQETTQDIKKTEKLLHRIRPDVFQLGIICPYPGTEIFEIMKKENLISSFKWSEFNFMHSRPRWGTRTLSGEELVKLQKRIYRGYLLSPRFLFRLAGKLCNPFTAGRILQLCFYMTGYLLFEKRRAHE